MPESAVARPNAVDCKRAAEFEEGGGISVAPVGALSLTISTNWWSTRKLSADRVQRFTYITSQSISVIAKGHRVKRAKSDTYKVIKTTAICRYLVRRLLYPEKRTRNKLEHLSVHQIGTSN